MVSAVGGFPFCDMFGSEKEFPVPNKKAPCPCLYAQVEEIMRKKGLHDGAAAAGLLGRVWVLALGNSAPD